MKNVIITIGGGDVKNNENTRINTEILKHTGKVNPCILFIPTASNDPLHYIEEITNEFTGLGARVETLCLIREDLSESQIREKIEAADAIYVGGGNTREMLKLWHQRGVDSLIAKAYESGTVLAGLSAGSICWYLWGNSDSNSFGHEADGWQWTRVDGLGYIKASHVPHYDEPGRTSYDEMFEQDSRYPGIALDNQVALCYYPDSSFEIIKDNVDKRAFKFTMTDNGLCKYELETGVRYRLT